MKVEKGIQQVKLQLEFDDFFFYTQLLIYGQVGEQDVRFFCF